MQIEIFKKIKFCHILTRLVTKRYFVLLIILCLGISTGYTQNTVTIIPQETPVAFKNPLKGFRGGEFSSLSKIYIKWSDIESNEADGIDKIREYCKKAWGNFPTTNRKAIPRVYLDWDINSGNEYWPADMKSEDYTSQQFKDRMVRLIGRLGELWDHDPSVAYVEMGIFGFWGEQEQPRPDSAMQKLAGDAFVAAFKNKKVMVRSPWNMFKDYPFGAYWDSFAHLDQRQSINYLASIAPPRWIVAPIGGECAYDWGSYKIQPGDNPDNTLSEAIHLSYLHDLIRQLHCNHLGWVSEYTNSDTAVEKGAQFIQKAFGHRFVIKNVTYPKRINAGTNFDVSFSVVNTGSSPFYEEWPVEISLLDTVTKKPVFSQIFDSVNITKWLPGDSWQSVNQAYAIPAITYTANGTFRLPFVLEKKTYILALAMLEPAGGKPNNRFAIKNYFTGGRHPIGYTGVDEDVAGVYEIDTTKFNSFNDNTLNYDPNVIVSTLPAIAPQIKSGLHFSVNGVGNIFIAGQNSIKKIEIYNLLGKLVKTIEVPNNKLFWNGADNSGLKISQGIYLIRFMGKEFTYLSKVVVIK